MQNNPQYDVITSGYVSMDRIIKLKTPARVGFTSLVENRTSADIRYGGCSVNISYDLCRLGIRSLPVMRVGDDYEQIGFKRFLEEGGISLAAAEVVPGERTSVCYLLQDNEGQHITLFYPGAMDARFARPLPDSIFTGARLGVMTVGSRPDNEAFFAMCKKHGLPLVFSMKGDMDAFPRDFLEELLSYSSIIFTNEVERRAIEQILGVDLRAMLNRGRCSLLITTLGRQGSDCWYKADGAAEKTHVPICTCGGPVADATGSGDAFVAGFLYGFLRGKDPRTCAMLGTVLSSFVIEQEGCCAGAPTEGQLLERFEQFERMLKGGG